MTRPHADVAILGAGCAGLSLARRLANLNAGERIVLIEPRDAYGDDRSWCFWAGQHHTNAHLVSKFWPRWQFSTAAGTTQTHHVEGVSYQYVRSLDFYTDALERIDGREHIEFLSGVSARRISQAQGLYSIETDRGDITARSVVDTRSIPHETIALLYQCFVGAEIEHPPLPSAALDTAGLMEAMSCDDDGFHFLYVLPLAPGRSLMEVTRFAKRRIPQSALDAQLSNFITQHVGAEARRIRTEYGTLPMGISRPAPLTAGPRHVLAGNAGGALRPASGYAFQRIQAWADACAASIQAGAGVIGQPNEPAMRGLMDRIFLHALRAQPERAAEFFMAIAERLEPAAFVRFMSDAARLRDTLGVVAALPPAPFLKAAWKNWQTRETVA